MATNNEAIPDETEQSDYSYANQGMWMWLNNEPIAAEEHFKKRKQSNVVLIAYAFVLGMNGAIAYEQDKITEAEKIFEEIRERCTPSSWFSSVRTRLFGENNSEMPVQVVLENQIILADSYLCTAILTFITQDFKGLIKGSWLLRKAYKLYQSTYSDLYEMFRKKYKFGSNLDDMPPKPLGYVEPIPRSQSTIHATNSLRDEQGIINQSNSSSSRHLVPGNEISSASLASNTELNPSKSKLNLLIKENYSNQSVLQSSFVVQSPLSCPTLPDKQSLLWPCNSDVSDEIEINELIRLLGATCYGYGLFLLSISLMPNNLLRLISIFGIDGNKETGLECLLYARKSKDLRAPIARLSLIWFYTYSWNVDEEVRSDVDLAKATELFDEVDDQFSDSGIFLFFRGRLESLKGNISLALQKFERCCEIPTVQRELKTLCLHETGYCKLIQHEIRSALLLFSDLRNRSVFYKAFYIYVMALCQGILGELKVDNTHAKDIQNELIKSKQTETQVGKYLSKRLEKLTPKARVVTNSEYWELLLYEMLYFWNFLKCSVHESSENILKSCTNAKIEPGVGVNHFILGVVYSLMNRNIEAIAELTSAIKKRENIDTHDASYVDAYGRLELAALLLKDGNSSSNDIRHLLLEASSYKRCDFENRFSIRLRKLMKKLP